MGGWSPRQRESHRGRRADALSVARNCASGPVSSTPQGAQAVHTATRAEPAEGVPCLAPSLRGSQDSPASRRTADNAGHFAWRDRAVPEGAGGSRTAQGTAKPTPPSNGVSRTRIGARRGCVPGPTHLPAPPGSAATPPGAGFVLLDASASSSAPRAVESGRVAEFLRGLGEEDATRRAPRGQGPTASF